LYNDWGQVNQLGILYISADEISRAKELLEMFISKDPENEKASLARGILKSLIREF